MCTCASPREFHILCSTSLEPNLSIPEVPIGPTVHTGSILNRLSSVIAVSGHRQRRRRVEAGHRCQAGAEVHGRGRAFDAPLVALRCLLELALLGQPELDVFGRTSKKDYTSRTERLCIF